MLLSAILVTSLATVQDPVQFEPQVLPILEQRCFSCHASEANGGPRRPKAGLRLDGQGWILKGVFGEPIVTAGKPESSTLFTLVSLPADDVDRMPPKGDPLSTSEIELLRRWITEGAEYGDWVGAAGGAELPSKDDVATSETETLPARVKLYRDLGAKLSPATPAALARVGKLARVEPVLPNSPLLRVSFVSHETEVDDKELAKLAPLKRHITHLNLAKTKIGSDSLKAVAAMPLLTTLDLHRTTVSDSGLRHLAGLDELRSLNLYGTKVGDAAVASLAKLKKLEVLYVWETAMSEKAIAKLAEKLPKTRIVHERKLPKPNLRADDD